MTLRLIVKPAFSHRKKRSVETHALRLSGTKNLHFANAPFPRFSANADENGHDALYDVNISRINNSQSFEVSITAEGQPSLSVYFEINRGVPAMHITKDPHGDMDLHIHSGKEGYFICPETRDNYFEQNNDANLNYDSPNALFLEAAEPELDDEPEESWSPRS